MFLRVVLLLFIAINFLYSTQNLDKKEFSSILETITNINIQLQIAKEKIKEQNQTINSLEYDKVYKKRDNLIAKIPPFIIYGKYLSPIDKLKYSDELKQLKYKISKYKKSNNLNLATKNSILLYNLTSTHIFYTTLDSIKNQTKSQSLTSSFENILEESLLNLRAISLPDLPKPNKNTQLDISLQTSKNTLKATISTYIQILDYLNKNITLLKSNSLFSKLDIDYIINYINQKTNSHNTYLNAGKGFVCLIILSIFWFIIYLLKKRKFLIFITPFKKTTYDLDTKTSIIKSTNRPLIGLAAVIGIKLCFNIIFYPYANPAFVSTMFSILYIVNFAWLIIGVLNGYGLAIISTMAKQEDTSFRKDVVNLILKIFYFLVIIIAFLMILGKLGVNVSAIVASLGIGGLAVAWASKDILANFFSSILLLIDNSFSQGDWIVCGSSEGIVIEIGLRRTTIRTFDNSILFVPNLILANNSIQNWSRRKVGRRIRMHIGLTYDSPKEKIELCVKDIRKMLFDHEGIAKPTDTSLSKEDRDLSIKKHIVSIQDLKGYRRTLLVYLDNFSASSIDILIYCFSQSTNWEQWLITKEDIMLKIMDIVHGHGLSFAFPSQSLYIETMPKDELKDKLITKSDEKIEQMDKKIKG